MEYVLLIALIALAVIAAVIFMGDALNNSYSESASELDNRL